MTLKNNSSMKRMAICLSALAVWCGAAAQETVPPRFQGSDAKRFMARLIGETEKIVDAAQIPAAELSSQVVVGFTVDETGNVTQWRFLDRTCAGKDSVGVEPATPRTREAMTEALGRLEKWTPAMKDGKPTTYSWRLTMRLPVEKIAKKQDADPLLFLGGDPDKTFHEWASLRLRYDGRFTGRGAKGEGVVRVRFYIEPDGKITIGEVIKSPDEKLSREMIRVIRSSKGKWTPRKVRGVPQRTAYEYGVNFLGMVRRRTACRVKSKRVYVQPARTPFSMHGLPGRDAGTRRSEQPSAAAGSLPGAGRAAPFLSVLKHRPGLLGVLGTHNDLCGHGAYGINGRHIFVADHRPDACAVEHRFGYLGFGDGVVFR